MLFLFAIAVAGSGIANAQQRMVLYEEFTGENCGPCASANPPLEALMAANPTKAIHVTYMEDIPAHTPHNFYQSAKTINDSRISYYNAYWTSLGYMFTPSGMSDGAMPDSSGSGSSFSCGNVSEYSQADIDIDYAKPSPFTVIATHRFNTAHDSVFGKVIINGVSAVASTKLKLRAVYVKSFDFASAPGTNGERHFENVARAMYPNAAGQTLPTVWVTGTTDTLTYKGKITGFESTLTGVTTLDSSFIVWIQNDSSGSGFKVHQAAKSTYTPLPPAEVAGLKGALENIVIAPNPSSTYINVNGIFSSPAATTIVITNTVGQTVIEKQYPAADKLFSQNIALDNLSSGVYFMTIANNGASTTKKFVVNK